jgi:hypothetical protein
LFLVVVLGTEMLAPSWFRLNFFGRLLGVHLAILVDLAVFQIDLDRAMDLTPLLGVDRLPERVLKLMIISILVFTSCIVDLVVFMLLFGPLAFVVKEPSPCL